MFVISRRTGEAPARDFYAAREGAVMTFPASVLQDPAALYQAIRSARKGGRWIAGRVAGSQLLLGPADKVRGLGMALATARQRGQATVWDAANGREVRV